ncbi:BsuPI-related putative proteinase inhibitor [Aliikangiella sp. IMCC44653]
MKLAAKSLILLASLSTSFAINANDYLPHSSNDYSVFENQYQQQVKVEVNDTYGENWRRFSHFLGKSNQWIATSSFNQRVVWYSDTGESQLLVDFNDAVGTEYQVDIDECVSKATLVEKAAVVSTKASRFNDAVKLTFQSSQCADVGLLSAHFVAGVGLVQWQTQSIAGPVTYALQSSKIGDMQLPQSQGLQIKANVDSGPIDLTQKQSINAYLVVTNPSNHPVELTFNSGQRFEIEIFNSAAEKVAQWSFDKMFTEAIDVISIAPKSEKMFGDVMPLKDFNGRWLAAGNYKVKVTLTGYNNQYQSVNDGLRFATEFPISILE